MAFSSSDPALKMGDFGFGPPITEIRGDEVERPPNAPDTSLKAKNFDKRGATVYTCLKNVPRTDEFRVETVCGVSPRVNVCVHPTRGFVVHAAGSMLVLWDWRTDTRLNLKGHIAPITSVACSPNGLFIASADCGPEPLIILWDVSGQAPGGRYVEVCRVRRDLSANVTWVHNIQLSFSLDNVYLVSVEVGERTDEGAQVCLWDWAQDFTLLQRCLIYDTGEQHIFPTKGENPFGVYDDFGKHPWESDKAGLGKASGKTDHRRRRRRRLKKQLKLQYGGESDSKIVWVPGSNNFAVVFSHILWVFETNKGAMRLLKQQQFQGTKHTYELVDVVASEVYRLIVVLCRSGQVFVCDSGGNIVNHLGAPVKKKAGNSFGSRIRGNKSTKKEMNAQKHRTFTCINNCGDMIFVGSSDGCIWTVEIRTLTWKRKLPFQHHLRERIEYPKEDGSNSPAGSWNSPVRVRGKEGPEKDNERGPGWPVASIATTSDDAFIVTTFGDHTIAVFDLHNGRVTNHAVTHFGGVHSACWHPDATSSVLVTGGADQTLCIWQMILPMEASASSYFAQGRNMLTNNGPASGLLDPIASKFWRAKPTRTVDVSTSLDPGLRYQRISRTSMAIAAAADQGGMFGAPKLSSSISRAAAAVEITAVAYHPRGGRIACGCSHGMVRVYNTMSGRLLYLRDIGYYTRGRAYGSSTSARVANPGIMECTDIKFSKEGRYLACALAGGMTAVMDSWGAYMRGSVVTAGFEKAAWPGGVPPRLSCAFAQRPMGVRPPRLNAEEAASGTCVITCGAIDKIIMKEVQPGEGTLYSRKGANRDPETASMEGPATLTGLECPTVAEYKLDSACTTFSVHSSGDYLICLSQKGTILIYHLWLGDLRGIIPTSAIPHPGGTRPCFVQDPSGLYIAATSPVIRESESMQLGASSMIACYRVVIYEICTGRYAGHITDLPIVQFLSWSPCGTRLTLGGADGCINVYRVSAGIYRNIEAALVSRQQDIDFWEGHPIYLEPFRPTRNAGSDIPKATVSQDRRKRKPPPRVDFRSGMKLENGHYVLVSIRQKRIVELFFTLTGERKRFKLDDGTLLSLSVCDYDHERIEVLKSVLTPMRTNTLHLKERRLREKIRSGDISDINCRVGMKLQDNKFVLVSVKNGRSVEVFTPSNGNQLRLRVNESALASLAVCDTPAEQVEVLRGILEGIVYY